jgi:hypothetical protein
LVDGNEDRELRDIAVSLRLSFLASLVRRVRNWWMNSTLGRADIERCESEDRCREGDGSLAISVCQAPTPAHESTAASIFSYCLLADCFLDSFLGEFLSNTLTR